MLDAALSAAPWAIPGTLAAAVVGLLLMRRLAARLGVPRWSAWLLVTAVGGFCALTVTPAGGSLDNEVGVAVGALIAGAALALGRRTS